MEEKDKGASAPADTLKLSGTMRVIPLEHTVGTEVEVVVVDSAQLVVEPTYLGDAVYASFDGWNIWLHLNSQHSPGLVAIELRTLNALIEYAKRVGMIS